MEDKIFCAFCGVALSEDDAYYFDDTFMCEDCYKEKTTTCDNCNERIWSDEAEGDSYTTLCSHCYEYDYCTCEDCGHLIHHDDAFYEEDSDYPYCGDCFRKLEESVI